MHKYSENIIVRTDRVNLQGESPMYLQAFLNGSRVRLFLGVRVKSENFNKKAQRVRKSGKTVNAVIAKFKARANELFKIAIVNDRPLTPAQFKKLIFLNSAKKILLDFIIDEILKSVATEGTKKAYRQVVKHLRTFQRDALLVSVDYSFIVDFEKHLTRQNLSTNTIKKHHKNLKKFLNIAKQQNLITENPYTNFKIKSAKTSREYLSKEEIQKLVKLYDADIPKIWRKVLRQFLFMCFTSLRYSDMANLEPENVASDCLMFRPIKTYTRKMFHRVQLGEQAKKYLPDNFERRDKVFDTYKNAQSFNDTLSIICEHVKIRRATAHVARHTFATLGLESGIPVQVMQKILGHEDIATTMIYVHVSNKEQIKGVAKFDNMFN